MAERFKATVLKTVVPTGTVSSNLTISAEMRAKKQCESIAFLFPAIYCEDGEIRTGKGLETGVFRIGE